MADVVVIQNQTITIRDRLECGNLTVHEVCALKKRSLSGFYKDVKAGLVEIRKHGRRTFIRGPDAARYIAAEPPRAVA